MTAPALQRFALNFWTLTTSKVLYRLVSIGVAMYLARALGAGVLGAYAAVMNVLTLFLAFADLGVTNLVIKDVSRDRSLAFTYLDNFFVLQFFVGLALIVLIMLTGVLSGYEHLWLIALAIGSAGPFFSGLSNAYEALLNAHERFYPFAVIEFVCMLAFLLGNGAVVLAGGGLVALIAVTSLVSLLRFILGAAWARRFDMRVRLRFSTATVRAMLVAGLPFLLINGTHFAIQRMDILFLTWTLPPERIGIYAASSRLIFASLFLLSAVGALLYPVFSRLLHQQPERARELYVRGTLYLAVVAGIMAQLCITLAPVIIRILYGAAFAESAAVLQLLALFIPLFGFGLLASNVLMVSEGVWKAVAASVAGLAVGTILALPLIARFEITGAALAVIAAETVAATMYILWTRSALQLTPNWRRLSLAVFSLAAPPALLYAAGLLPGIVLGALSLLLSITLLFLSRALTGTDLRELTDMVRVRRQGA
ncbi:MAG: flippase [Bacteroidetes bacterium]|nr:flippase [Bacteroidota bacterium]